ncbi:Beta-aspartyl-peptidase [Saliniradius amylolyticus]|uniref:Isoaspartyl peptidase n=1 Tax=Saliniradius amylolyticus TaxID=2183582 RepID=A0A2S2E2G8_9ALTE|nr:isoaspartyl peptidase/L-asparaginase [Saliniradius amylolyticus]AWL11845.1 Beta-aspartyl-peptidase [Saliniradius amylolyticus]
MKSLVITGLGVLALGCLSLIPVQASEGPVAIAIHGGAGTITKARLTDKQEKAYRAKLQEAAEAGYAKLKAGAHGTEAVMAAITILEDSPLFNAGKGAVYTYDETHELDASIMEGRHRQAGAISGVTGIRNPITLAHKVMTNSKHVFLSGQGAADFAISQGITMVPNSYFNTERRYQSLQKAKQAIEGTNSAVLSKGGGDYKFGTVGAVVLDDQGNLVAGTSTGGMTAKRWGRIGDSPVIGAGTFADNDSCAVSATGHGEYFIRFNVAADICARVKYQNVSAAEAANTVIHQVLKPAGGDGGVIVIDSQGHISMPFNTEGMYRAAIDTDGALDVGIYGKK